jgi:hypothetical protein
VSNESDSRRPRDRKEARPGAQGQVPALPATCRTLLRPLVMTMGFAIGAALVDFPFPSRWYLGRRKQLSSLLPQRSACHSALPVIDAPKGQRRPGETLVQGQ